MTPTPHLSFPLIFCPLVPPANYIMTRVGPDDEREILKIGMVEHEASSLNLAEIRKIGATIGADEVHLHVPSRGATARRMVRSVFEHAQRCRTLHAV